MRGSPTRKRGWVAVAVAGTKQLYGRIRIVDCIGPLTMLDLHQTVELHRIEDPTTVKYKNTFAYVVDGCEPFEPVASRLPFERAYEHTVGATGCHWVKLRTYRPRRKRFR